MSYERPNIKRVRKLPSLTSIYDISDPMQRLMGFQDFLWCKSFEMSMPLTKVEQQLDDTFTLFKAIPREGWSSAFEDSLNYTAVLGVIDVLRFCSFTEVADSVAEALELFYNDRTDLHNNEHKRESGITGFRHPTERRRFLALGDIVEKLPYEVGYYLLLNWAVAHRNDFEDFPRP